MIAISEMQYPAFIMWHANQSTVSYIGGMPHGTERHTKRWCWRCFGGEGTDMDEPSGITNSYRRRATMCREQAAMTPTLCNRAVFLSQADGYEHFADIAESHAEDQSLHDDGLCEG